MPATSLAKGVSFEGALGYPSVKLSNFDGSQAVYSGIGLEGRAFVPIYGDGSKSVFKSDFTFGLRYLDLNNSANTDSQRETGNHIGPTVGLHFNLFRIKLGVEYNIMKGRHFWVGNAANDFAEFDYSALNTYFGMEWEFSKSLTVSVYLSQSSTTFTDVEINANQSVRFSDSTYWLSLRYNTGSSFDQFLGNIFN